MRAPILKCYIPKCRTPKIPPETRATSTCSKSIYDSRAARRCARDARHNRRCAQSACRNQFLCVDVMPQQHSEHVDVSPSRLSKKDDITDLSGQTTPGWRQPKPTLNELLQRRPFRPRPRKDIRLVFPEHDNNIKANTETQGNKWFLLCSQRMTTPHQSSNLSVCHLSRCTSLRGPRLDLRWSRDGPRLDARCVWIVMMT